MLLNRRNLLIGTGGALLSSVLPTWAAETQMIGGPAFGSWWRAVLPTATDAREIKVAIETVVSSVDNAMSPFKKASEVSRLNAAIDTDWQTVSDGVREVIAESLRIAQLTDGAFDPTVGPIVGRYGFGPITGSSLAGYQSIQLHEGKLRKTDPEASLDLCGIAKGHALDRMADVLTTRGINSFLLEAGGEVLARGLHPNGRQWQAAVETPDANPRAFQRIVELDERALATSGDSINGGQEEGLSFNHIINPHTELPIENGVASVSVIANTAMEADALATALMVMGGERGLALAERKGIAVMFLTRDLSGIFESMSKQFSRYIVA
jgi:thiamine biosynthesis lipoprotein